MPATNAAIATISTASAVNVGPLERAVHHKHAPVTVASQSISPKVGMVE